MAHDDDATAHEVAASLSTHGYVPTVFASAVALLEAIRSGPPEVLVIGPGVGELTGMEVLGEVRMMQEARLMPVVLLAGAAVDEDEVVRALLAGADDYVTNPERLRELAARVRVQLRNRRDRELLAKADAERAQLRDALLVDTLTGVGNRRAADRMLNELPRDAVSHLVMVIDIDHFKSVNDTHGHAVGDSVLRSLGKTLRRLSREGDCVARYGGEEFLVVITDAPRDRHLAIAERFLRGVRSMKLPEACPVRQITASMGVHSWGTGDVEMNGAAMFRSADEALYEAKEDGRDRMVFRTYAAADSCERIVSLAPRNTPVPPRSTPVPPARSSTPSVPRSTRNSVMGQRISPRGGR